MRPSLLVSLLLFSILISDVQGIRLNKGFLSVGHHKIHERIMIRGSNEAVGEAIHCKDEQCSGIIRKLLSKVTSNPAASTPISKNDKNGETKATGSTSTGKSNTDGLGGKEESFSVNSSPVSENWEAPEHYPDILDIAGMDYTPAKRKPPIHN